MTAAAAPVKSKYGSSKAKEDFLIDSKVHWEGAHSLCGTLSQRWLNPIKQAHVQSRPDGRSHSGQHLTD